MGTNPNLGISCCVGPAIAPKSPRISLPAPPQVALITGASTGIGAACARQFIANGWLVASVSLEEIAEPDARHLALRGDITEEAVRQEAVNAALRAYGRIDALVNNAGIGLYETVSQTDPVALERLFAVNVTAAVRMTQLALPALRRQGECTVVNIGSVAGYCSLPWAAAYCATKSALHSFSDGLRRELRDENIRVVRICPGIVATNFRSHVIAGRPPGRVESLSWVVTAEDVADAVVSAAEGRGGHTVYVPWIGRVFGAAGVLLPSTMDWYLGRLARQYAAPTPAGNGETS